jgi:hypothetical protein
MSPVFSILSIAIISKVITSIVVVLAKNNNHVCQLVSAFALKIFQVCGFFQGLVLNFFVHKLRIFVIS